MLSTYPSQLGELQYMSKLTKFITSPKAYFRDALKNFLNMPTTTAQIATQAKSTTSTKKTPPTPSLTLIFDTISISKQYHHLIHTGEGMTHGPSHLSQWIPYFIQSGESFAVLVRNIDLYKWVRSTFPNVAVIYAKSPTDIENILNKLAFIKGIYYLSNTGNLIHTLRYNVYKHIFLGHGDSDKSASAHKFFRVYDQVWVSGQAHIDRFKNARFDVSHMQFIKIGRPTLAHILKDSETPHTIAFSKILYLPTWEGVYEESNYSSIRISATMLTEIYKKFDLYISAKFHPVTGSRDSALRNAPVSVSQELHSLGVNHYIADKLVPVSELILGADIYICDISAVVSECIAANRPLFVYIPRDKEINVAQSDMSYEDYAYTFSNIQELLDQLEQVLNGNDFKRESRTKARDYLLSVQETSNGEFFTQLQKVASENVLLDNFREQVIQ